MNDKDSRFDDRPPATPPPSPLRASNTLESLRPREVTGYQTPSGGHVSLEEVLAPQKAYERGLENIRETDNPKPENAALLENARRVGNENEWRSQVKYTGPSLGEANVLPVNWPASSNKPPKPVLLPSVYDRVTKLEEQIDALLDRIALHNVRSSHKI